jgi:hypothetical protein
MRATVIDLVGKIYGSVKGGEIASTVYSKITEQVSGELSGAQETRIKLQYAGKEIINDDSPIQLLTRGEFAKLPRKPKGSYDKIYVTIKIPSSVELGYADQGDAAALRATSGVLAALPEDDPERKDAITALYGFGGGKNKKSKRKKSKRKKKKSKRKKKKSKRKSKRRRRRSR